MLTKLLICLGLLITIEGAAAMPADDGQEGLEIALTQDIDVVQSLVDNGSNVAKPHPIRFYLYFSTERGAREAAESLRADGMSILKIEAGSADSWLALAEKAVVPSVSNMQGLTRSLTALAKRHGGTYDGWEAPIIR